MAAVPSDVQDDYPELVQSQTSITESQGDIRSLATPPPDSEPEHASDTANVDTNSDLDDIVVDAYVSAVGKAVFDISKERLLNNERAIIYFSGSHVQVIVSTNEMAPTNEEGPLDASKYGTVDRLWERCRDAMSPWYPNLSDYDTTD
ncbi:hypothetical protein AAF712_015822 [Marasmius tenuissimus]|uniref:Uncharacterized protein n=1 Tax=Marasmius tenuissimus TaxID=585030 RepID=A0ABR2Z874_9AGAR